MNMKQKQQKKKHPSHADNSTYIMDEGEKNVTIPHQKSRRDRCRRYGHIFDVGTYFRRIVAIFAILLFSHVVRIFFPLSFLFDVVSYCFFFFH